MISLLARTARATSRSHAPSILFKRSLETTTRRRAVAATAAAPILTPHPDAALRQAFDLPLSSTSSSPSLTTTGLFSQPALTSPDAFTPLALRIIQRAQFIVERICSSTSSPHDLPRTQEEAEIAFLAMVKNLDRLSDLLCSVIDLCELVRNVHPSQEWRDGVDEAYSVLYEFMNELNTHVGLYESLRAIHSILDPSTPSKSTALFAAYAVAIPFLRDFEKSGIHLPPDQRTKFVDLSSSILTLGRKFLQNTAEPGVEEGVLLTAAEVTNGFSESFARRVFEGSKKRVIDPASWEGRVLARQHPDESVRRKLFMALHTPKEGHVEVLEEMLSQRAELAQLVGRGTWGDVALEDKMAKTPENVDGFLAALNKHNLPRARADMELLRTVKESLLGRGAKVQPWDRDFLTDMAPTEGSASPLPDISPFFSVGTCFQGLSRLFTSLYGIRFEVEDVLPGEVWEPSVKKLRVVDEDEGQIGTIYCDLFAREGKGPGAAHYTVRCSRRIDDDDEAGDFDAQGRAIWEGVEFDRAELQGLKVDPVEYRGREGKHQSPIIVLVCGFGSGAQDGASSVARPAYLQWHEVETLFHEMGHAIHSMIGRTDYHNVAGTRCATDFVELPSILMEHFVSSPSVVSLFTSHASTGRPLPTSILQSVLAERRQFSALETSTQITMAALDQAYHSKLPLSPSFSSIKVLQRIQTEYNVVPYAEGTAWQTQFGHLFGYGATYYSYLFDRAIAARVFGRRFAQDPLSRESGEGFKRMLLKWGGGKDPWEMVGEVVESDVVARGGREAMEEVGRYGIEEAVNGK